MKTLAIALALGSSLVLSANHAVAAPASQLANFATKTYGDLKPGQTFSLKVKTVISSKTVGTTVVKNTPVPSFIPKLKKNQKVTFKIGKKGELTGPKFSAKFLGTTGPSLNDYLTASKNGQTLSTTGKLEKNTKKKPVALILGFEISKFDTKTFQLTTHQVTYTFK